MESAVINNWGAGLVNALVPKKDDANELRLNCAVIDFDFDKGKGEAKTLFLDAKRTRVTGKGDIDLRDNTVDIVMKTNPKQLALLDMTPAVLVKGDLTNPSVSPSKLSLGKKIGGILLGTVNPALLAVSLSDLGISEGHPCHESINKLEESMREDEPSAPKVETPAENTGNDPDEAQ